MTLSNPLCLPRICHDFNCGDESGRSVRVFSRIFECFYEPQFVFTTTLRFEVLDGSEKDINFRWRRSNVGNGFSRLRHRHFSPTVLSRDRLQDLQFLGSLDCGISVYPLACRRIFKLINIEQNFIFGPCDFGSKVIEFVLKARNLLTSEMEPS